MKPLEVIAEDAKSIGRSAKFFAYHICFIPSSDRKMDEEVTNSSSKIDEVLCGGFTTFAGAIFGISAVAATSMAVPLLLKNYINLSNEQTNTLPVLGLVVTNGLSLCYEYARSIVKRSQQNQSILPRIN